jgi:uncharacterized protein YukE
MPLPARPAATTMRAMSRIDVHAAALEHAARSFTAAAGRVGELRAATAPAPALARSGDAEVDAGIARVCRDLDHSLHALITNLATLGTALRAAAAAYEHADVAAMRAPDTCP